MAGTYGATSTTDEVLEGVDLSGKLQIKLGQSVAIVNPPEGVRGHEKVPMCGQV